MNKGDTMLSKCILPKFNQKYMIIKMSRKKLGTIDKKKLMEVAKKAKAENDYFKSIVFDEFYVGPNKQKGERK